jgi:large subunit ribosomal protein L15
VIQTIIEKKKITHFDMEVFMENGLASSNDLVKVLGRGELNGAITISAHKFSSSAKANIQAKGGNVIEL